MAEARRCLLNDALYATWRSLLPDTFRRRCALAAAGASASREWGAAGALGLHRRVMATNWKMKGDTTGRYFESRSGQYRPGVGDAAPWTSMLDAASLNSGRTICLLCRWRALVALPG